MELIEIKEILRKASIEVDIQGHGKHIALFETDFEKVAIELVKKLTIPDVVGSASRELVVCADCDYRHDKMERVKKKGKVWTTYHCPKCGSESTCRVS